MFNLENLYAQATTSLAEERPLIAITGNFGEKGCELAEGYYQSLLRAGATPVVIPPTTDLTTINPLLQRVDGILLSGGADLNPLWMGEEPHTALGALNPVRDAFELLLIRRAVDHQIPLLGICRGMQMLAAALGGKVEQDMATAHPNAALLKHSQAAPRSEATHRITLDENSQLAQVLGRELFVNSFHHQAVAETGTQLRPVAFAADGTLVQEHHRRAMASRVHGQRRLRTSFPSFRATMRQLSPRTPVAPPPSLPRLPLRHPNVFRSRHRLQSSRSQNPCR